MSCHHPGAPHGAPHRNGKSGPHPLDPLSAQEVITARRVLDEAGRLSDSTRFPLILLDEPGKAAVAAFRPGDPVPRRARVTLLDTLTGSAAEALVDIAGEAVLAWRDLRVTEPPYGQPPILFEEYERCDAIVKADPGWRAAMEARGITDLDLVVATPLAAGNFGDPDENGRRLLRSLTFLRCDEADNPWAHPVAGLLAVVDVTERRVIRLVDTGPVPVPAECGRYDPQSTGPPRTGLKPLEITQPEGPSFTLDGTALTWQKWSLRIGFNAREGLVLHRIGYRDGDRLRPVLHRASLSEMAVPYALPGATRNFMCYLDMGEYLLGRNVNALRLGCDCLGDITYLDAVLHDDEGRPYTAQNAVCVHEEDYGLLWKHTNIFDDMSVESRRSRRLVISFIATLGNYDYGFYWYLYQDGTVAFEVKATGLLFTDAVEPGTASPYATEVAPGLIAPFHQHLFCARLDMDVDGGGNTVEEVDVVPLPMGPDNPRGNAFTTSATPVTDSGGGGRLADPSVARSWRVVNRSARNRLGQPTGYTLMPRPGPLLLARPGSPNARRVTFGSRHLWVTRTAPERRYPTGDYPNQHEGGDGVAAWTSPGESLEDTDLTLWHVFGPTHLPRPEEWPVMPVDHSGFALRPSGFFDRNPSLDLPRERGNGPCHS